MTGKQRNGNRRLPGGCCLAARRSVAGLLSPSGSIGLRTSGRANRGGGGSAGVSARTGIGDGEALAKQDAQPVEGERSRSVKPGGRFTAMTMLAPSMAAQPFGIKVKRR